MPVANYLIPFDRQTVGTRMRVTVFPCGAAVNESEATAIDRLTRELQKIGSDDEWILLTNLAFSVTHQFQSDESDIIAIGPPRDRSQALVRPHSPKTFSHD
jgi:hypothetical protein